MVVRGSMYRTNSITVGLSGRGVEVADQAALARQDACRLPSRER